MIVQLSVRNDTFICTGVYYTHIQCSNPVNNGVMWEQGSFVSLYVIYIGTTSKYIALQRRFSLTTTLLSHGYKLDQNTCTVLLTFPHTFLFILTHYIYIDDANNRSHKSAG